MISPITHLLQDITGNKKFFLLLWLGGGGKSKEKDRRNGEIKGKEWLSKNADVNVSHKFFFQWKRITLVPKERSQKVMCLNLSEPTAVLLNFPKYN